MVPVEVTAFALLAACVILLAIVLAVQFAPLAGAGRAAMLLVLVLVVILAVYVLLTTRLR